MQFGKQRNVAEQTDYAVVYEQIIGLSFSI